MQSGKIFELHDPELPKEAWGVRTLFMVKPAGKSAYHKAREASRKCRRQMAERKVAKQQIGLL